MNGDVDATLEWCDLPCTLETVEQRVVVTTEAHMRAVCAAFIETLRTKRLTYMIRRCLDAKFRDDETLWVSYETRYVRDRAILADESYLGFVILRHRGDRWKISTMQFAADGSSPSNVALNKSASKARGTEAGTVAPTEDSDKKPVVPTI